MKASARLIAGLMLLAAGSAYGERMAWATIDSSAATPKLEAGERFFESMASSGGAVQFKLQRRVKAVTASCIEAADGDAANCVALVRRDPGQKSFYVPLHRIVSEKWPDNHLSSALSHERIAGKFTVIVFLE